jgi:cupin superfamily acireductone dioxygenase involved in methionine salvage
MVLRGRLEKPNPDSVAEHEEIREVIADEIKAGDVVVIPAGTDHWFTRIEDPSTISWCGSIPTK